MTTYKILVDTFVYPITNHSMAQIREWETEFGRPTTMTWYFTEDDIFHISDTGVFVKLETSTPAVTRRGKEMVNVLFNMFLVRKDDVIRIAP